MEKSVYELITELCEKHIDKRKCVYESINIQPILKKMRAIAFEVLLKKKHITESNNELQGNTDPICHLLAWQYTLKNQLNNIDKATELGIFIDRLKSCKILEDSIIQKIVLFLLCLKDTRPESQEKNLVYLISAVESPQSILFSSYYLLPPVIYLKLRGYRNRAKNSTNEFILKYSLLEKVNLKHKNSTDNSALPYDLYQQHKFQFSPEIHDKNSLPVFSTKSFKSEPNLALTLCKTPSKHKETVLTYSSHYKFGPLVPVNKKIDSKESKSETSVVDEGYESPVKDDGNIWELVSKLPVNNYRTWESLDNIDPKKELPFACESGPKTLHLFQKILNANVYNFLRDDSIIEEILISSQHFIKCVKFMLVGMTSDIFITNPEGLFYLKEQICIEGVSPMAMKSYCNDLLFCGSSYRALHNLSSSESYKSNEHDGYIFKELCESVKRFLAFYRVAALSFPDSADILTVHSHMRELRQQIGALVKVCRVPPGVAPGLQRFRGAQLLDYMYREITETVDRNVQLCLYAVFYPCCQIYFSRFLQRWLFEGVVLDPYEEFIIKSETNYVNSRARIYWTRSFSLDHSSVPEFLSDLKVDILQCGKTMNLLKLCNPDASLYTHIMSRSLPLISCCLTPQQCKTLKQDIDCYYVEMAALCGPRISLYHRLRDRYGNEENAALLSSVEKKRALAFKEMELKKQYAAEEKAKMKRKIFEEMQEQMRLAAEQKKKAMLDELKEELKIAEQAAEIEELRSKLVKEETKLIIKYYNNLIEAVDKRRNSMENRKQKLLESSIDIASEYASVYSDLKVEDNVSNKSSSTDDSKLLFEDCESGILEVFDSTENMVDEINKNIGEENKPKEEEKNTKEEKKNTKEENKSKEEKLEKSNLEVKTEEHPKNLDVQNANNQMTNEELLNQRNENFKQARANRAKILNLEFNTKISQQQKINTIPIRDTSNLTDAQKNKLKVLGSEFDVYLNPKKINDTIENNGNIQTVAIATTSDNQPSIVLTKEKAIESLTNEVINNDTNIIKTNSNLASPGHEDVMNLIHRKKILKLPKPNELLTIYERQNSANDPIPMSVDSTPLNEFSDLPTPSSAKLSLNTDICLDTPSILESAILTANSCITDDGFRYPVSTEKKSTYESTKLLFANKKICNITQNIPKNFRPMRISKLEVEQIKNGNLKSLLHQSVYIPLEAQMKLVNSEIIKYFVNEQNFLSHLHSLRSYYFFFDGEFARFITENLFSKLYDSKSPVELLSCRSLQIIIEGAIHASSKIQENGNRLSFIVRNIPRSFDLNSAEVFECLSLSYKISWPLNVILPYDTLDKYDIVFKYLLKLQHMSWVLQKISFELKTTQKEHGIDETLLFTSPQYHRIQLYRHTMQHFIQTLLNYTFAEVLQTSWDELENNLKNVTTLDQLYSCHVLYIKNIMFRCLLNRKCESIMKVIREIFVTILKFYNYLRSRSWNLRENDIFYTHPNFRKIDYIFGRFEEFTNFVFRVGNKMAKVGYQPHLIQMLDMLNVNDYYTNKQKK